jgi:DNA-binding transcriptional LysR family regulator
MDLPKHLDLRHLAIYVAVAETKSMAAAAERFGVTQAAVSQATTRLERAVGRDLLDRSTRPFQLTAAGARVERHGRDIVAHTSNVYRNLTDGAGLTSLTD